VNRQNTYDMSAINASCRAHHDLTLSRNLQLSCHDCRVHRRI